MRRPKAHDDEGAATVEFVLLVVALLVPLTYVVLTVLTLQRSAFGLTEAAREAVRGYVTTPIGGDGEQRARAAASLALHDQGIDLSRVWLTFDCSASPCLTPSARLTVRIETVVPLPWVPDLLGRQTATVPVVATQTEVVDPYAPVRP